MTSDERKLLSYFRALDSQKQQSLLDFAAYLSEQRPVAGKPRPEQPRAIEAAENESVVAALRRLSKSYFMLQDHSLLDDATKLMSQHMIQGREAVEVIEELEILFSDGYQTYVDKHEVKKNESSEK